MSIHSDIEKFWSVSGCRIIELLDFPYGDLLGNVYQVTYWLFNNNTGSYINIVAQSNFMIHDGEFSTDTTLKYFLNNSEYSEEEMLKIIQLKAFI